MSEEISQGGPDDVAARPASRSATGSRTRTGARRAATWAGALVVTGVVVWQVASIVGQPPRPAPPAAAHTLPPVPARTGMTVDTVCLAYTGSGPVEVSFRLVNQTGERVRLLEVTPQLPLAMLEPTSSVIAAGTCGPKGAGAPDVDLQPGESTPVTFRLTPVVQCPQPAPVQAAVRAVQGDIEIDRTVRVLSDLGQLKVPGC